MTALEDHFRRIAIRNRPKDEWYVKRDAMIAEASARKQRVLYLLHLVRSGRADTIPKEWWDASHPHACEVSDSDRSFFFANRPH